ncbi:helix-turn-helix domain-containing protein [Nocardia arthritidis]|uniref:helix-turn-helix domain-containing protein n=1 Tax=Nocardia arthritidis TaxID=228602 RepID=UPI000A8E5F2C
MAESGGSTLPRRQLGRHLRNGREAAGLTLADVGERMQWSVSTVQRMEVGKTAMPTSSSSARRWVRSRAKTCFGR